MSNDPVRDVLFPTDDYSTAASASDLAAQRLGLEKSLKEFTQSGRFAGSREAVSTPGEAGTTRPVSGTPDSTRSAAAVTVGTTIPAGRKILVGGRVSIRPGVGIAIGIAIGTAVLAVAVTLVALWR